MSGIAPDDRLIAKEYVAEAGEFLDAHGALLAKLALLEHRKDRADELFAKARKATFMGAQFKRIARSKEVKW